MEIKSRIEETYRIPTSALVRIVKQELGLEEMDGKEIFKLLDQENQNVKRILEDWLFEIIMGLVNFVHIFNPSRILLGGGIMMQSYIIEYIGSKLPEYLMPNYKQVKLVNAKLGNNAGILGAANMAMGLEG